MYKMKTGNVPEYLAKQLTYVNENQPYHLRNASDFRLNKATNNTIRNVCYI